MQRLLEWGYGPLVLTLGENGVLVGHNGAVISLPAYPVEAVQNTTGAGDAFTAGIVTGTRMHLPLEQAARLGTAVAALKLRQPGAQAGLPTLEEAINIMRKT